MGQYEAGVYIVLVIFLSIIVFTALIIRFNLKKKELEMRGSNAELGPEVDALRDNLADMQEHTRAHLADSSRPVRFMVSFPLDYSSGSC